LDTFEGERAPIPLLIPPKSLENLETILPEMLTTNASNQVRESKYSFMIKAEKIALTQIICPVSTK